MPDVMLGRKNTEDCRCQDRQSPFIVLAMGLKPSPSGETFRFFRWAKDKLLDECPELSM